MNVDIYSDDITVYRCPSNNIDGQSLAADLSADLALTAQ